MWRRWPGSFSDEYEIGRTKIRIARCFLKGLPVLPDACIRLMSAAKLRSCSDIQKAYDLISILMPMRKR